MSVTVADATYPVELGFLPSTVAIPDPDRPGLLRAGPRASAPYGGETVEFHRCEATDWVYADEPGPRLTDGGVDTADLSGLTDLQRTLVGVRATGRLSDADAAAIRSALDGAVLPCAGGGSVTVSYVADEGLILRASGPDRTKVIGDRPHGMNEHGPSTSVHADQDVFGTPLTQLMDGRAPELLRHDSPDGRNDTAAIMLANIWIPLQQVVAPLVLADGRSVDRRRVQLRYGLPTGSFLDRDDDMAINDIWTFLHDPAQRWWFRSEMDHRSAYVFDTCSTPHGAGVLPGEDLAAAHRAALVATLAAVAEGDADGVARAAGEPGAIAGDPPRTTPALAAALARMAALLEEAATEPVAVCGERAAVWSAAARDVARSVVRMSVELRAVVSIGA
ncbi:MAG: hypothetical protein ACOYOP_01365 [Microthrixaceae bacterium]